MAGEKPEPLRRLPRAQRRKQILAAGQPEPARTAGRARQAVRGVIGAAVASDVDRSLPNTAYLEGQPS